MLSQSFITTKVPPRLPDADHMRAHVIKSLARYWSFDSGPISCLPLQVLTPQPVLQLPLRLKPVRMPTWATPFSVDGELLVPHEAIPEGAINSADNWASVDWILAAFLLLEGWHERIWEYHYGPIHSYSYRLKEWDQRVWQYAWVNRIGLFLRQWAIDHQGPNIALQLGPLPEAEIQITHDIDAINKTLPIRFKQGAFNLFNAARALAQVKHSQTLRCFVKAARFMFWRDDWWVFDHLLAYEQSSKIVATWHFYADPRRRSLRQWFFDPGYSIQSPSLRRLLDQVNKAGHRIGLHPGFDSWDSDQKIAAARDQLEQVSGLTVTQCRQHWLRFSWQHTWHSQVTAGLQLDTTLMFNDRPGFRTSTAISWQPWSSSSQAAHVLTVLPTVLMDSHCYDYQSMNPEQRQQAIKHWLGECRAVHGQMALLWHPHTMSEDYGWLEGFKETIAAIRQLHH